MATYIRFERGRDDLPWLTLGPFEWVQLTGDVLRIPDDITIAYINNSYDDWMISDESLEHTQYKGEIYSDIVIFSSEYLLNLDEENSSYNSDSKAHENACNPFTKSS